MEDRWFERNEDGWFQRNIVFFSGSIGLLILLLLFVLLCIAPSPIRVQQKPIAISHPQKGVAFVASLDSDHLEPGDQVSLHLKVLSDIPAPMDLEVCSELPDTVQPTKCKSWTPDSASTTLDLPVTAGQNAGTERMTVTVTALASSKASGPGFHQTILTLGPLRVEKTLHTLGWMWPYVRKIQATLKDLGVPILVAILGAWFTWTANRRAEKNSKLASRRAEENEVRRSQFAKMQKMTQNYYTHIVGHARNAVTYLKSDETDADQRAKFHLLGLLLYNARLAETEGGVFFTNLDAETVYRNAIYLIFERITKDLGGEKTFRAALKELLEKAVTRAKGSSPNPNTDYSATSPRFADFLEIEKDACITGWALPAAKSADRNLLICALGFLKAATSYEYDEPLYDHWYRKPKNVEYVNLPDIADIKTLPEKEGKRGVWYELLGNFENWFKAGGKKMDGSESGSGEPSAKMLEELAKTLTPQQPSA